MFKCHLALMLVKQINQTKKRRHEYMGIVICHMAWKPTIILCHKVKQTNAYHMKKKKGYDIYPFAIIRIFYPHLKWDKFIKVG
jgi:hypothetical protein